MKASPFNALPGPLRSAGRVVMVAILLPAVSGALTPTLQGMAWIEMACEAGGLHRLGDAILEFTPCEHCQAVRKMSEESGQPGKTPFPVERSETPRVFATLAAESDMPGVRELRTLEKFPIALSESAPRSRADRPVSPPPRRPAGAA